MTMAVDAQGEAREAVDISGSDTMIMNAVQLILAEKRPSLSALRTGIAVFALPLTVLGLLIATSRYYDFLQVIPLLVPVLIICGALALLGGYLVIRSIVRIHHHDRLAGEIKRKHSSIAEFMD